MKHFVLITILFFLFAQSLTAQVADYSPPELEKIDVVENLGGSIPLDLEFVRSNGDTFVIGEYFNQDKPVIVVLAYYNCPMLCSLVLNGLVDAAKQINFKPGEDYTILTISIDPTETPQLAAAKRKTYLEALGLPGADAGWQFCVGNSAASRELADSLGFKYYWDEKQEQWAHPAVLNLITPNGTISRYLYGIEFKPNDLRLGLLEASQGKIGTTVDKIILYCFHYDPDSKGYTAMAFRIMQIGGILTVVILGMFLTFLWARNRGKKPNEA